MPKLCDYENCRGRATYGSKRNCPLRCSAHKEEGMKLVCQICLCGKSRPNFNEPGGANAICCSSCKTETMVDVRNKKCCCGKAIPSYNELGETNAICCSSCKTETMVDVKNKKCCCGKAIPNFNEPEEKNAICCYSCKTASMVNVINKKCRCGKARPHFNEPGETISICCASCKTESMVNITSKKCKCEKAIPTFNEPGKTIAICCASCKTVSMVDVKNKKCLCGKAQPKFNEPGKTIPVCCFSCKSESMVLVINNCKGLIENNEPCPYTRQANPKYRNYCIECFRRNFPLDPLTFQIRSKTKEIAVRDYINANLEGFHHDKPLTTSHCDCSVRRRIDHHKLINNTLLVIETDENQHRSYSAMDEETRYDDLYMAFSGKWIYIRFNPDKYVAKNGKNKNPMISTRLPVLLDEINKQITRIENEENKELVERIYLYYDNYD